MTRSGRDSLDDVEKRRERSIDRVSREDSKKFWERSSERESLPHKESVERLQSSSRKWKDQNDEPLEELEKSGKQVRVSEGMREKRRQR